MVILRFVRESFAMRWDSGNDVLPALWWRSSVRLRSVGMAMSLSL